MTAFTHPAMAAARAAGIPIFTGTACCFDVVAQDGLSVSRAAVVEALPAFWARGAAIHEMHRAQPVGRVLSTTVTAEGLQISFYISNDNARARVENRCYRGLSLGFAFNRARDVQGHNLVGLDIEEVSLCPVPSCVGSLIVFTESFS